MFEYIRTHQRLMQFLLFLLIVPSFAIFGLGDYTRFRDDANVVAQVAGQPITQQEFDKAYREQLDRLRQAYGQQFDSKAFDTPEARKQILDNLIAQRAMMAEASRDRLTVSDAALQRSILETPGLTSEGKFDGERYKSLLALQGMTPAMFEARLRQEMAMQQVSSAIISSAFAPKAVATRLSDINDQEREVQQLLFKTADYAPQVKVTDDMLKDYYNKNSKQFAVLETARAEYVVLSNDVIASQLNVTDDDIAKYYEANKKRFSVEEQRRASHILISAKKDAPAAEKASAKAKAEQLLVQVRKSPADFAKLAKANSQDPGSAEKGGDLGFFGKGMMVKPFEEATFALKPGEISDVVQSDFGFHIIQLNEIKAGSTKPLDEVKGEILAELKKQQAAKKYSELAEVFTNTVYEQADSLKPAADKLKLKIETTPVVTRVPNPTVAPNVPYNNPKFLKALFTEDSIKSKRNTEAVEIAPNTLISGRIVEYKPATIRPFDEVKDDVRQRVIQAEASKLAKKAGEDKLAALKAKDDTAGFGATKKVSRTKNEGLDGAGVNVVLKADVSKLPSYVGTEDLQGYSIYRVGKVAQAAKPDAARRQTEQQQVLNALAQQETLAYLEVLKQKAKAKIIKPPATKTEGEGAKE
ncbi:MAG: SurA N-terminal domain-containing protein [Burkholderiales bacterium]|nr:SurA N-terminal domain-containing protein [Burkholderiales bacterium]